MENEVSCKAMQLVIGVVNWQDDVEASTFHRCYPPAPLLPTRPTVADQPHCR